jgi:peptidoglycan hydrolase-like protein with peptidoglycan-binding domain
MRNPKTIIGLVVLGVLLIALGILIGQMIPVIGQVRLEMSLTPTPEPDWPLSVTNVTPDPSMPTPVPVLRTGRTGQEVKDVQSRLYTLGYYSAEIDGQYGAATREAVTAFQKRNGLGADGIVGTETRTVLFSADARPWAPEETEAPAEETEPAP